jgi:hypothetical protein
MIRWITAFVLILGLQAALAQDDGVAADDPAAAPAPSQVDFVTHTSGSFGFAISVPDGGVLRTPDDGHWALDPEIAMVWEGGTGDPVSLVELRVDSIGDRITPEQFDEFYKALLDNWLSDGKLEPGVAAGDNAAEETSADQGAEGETAGAPEEGAGGADSAAPATKSRQPKYVITRANEPPYRFGNMDWSIIEVIDSGHESGDKVYYTIFATYSGESIYTIGFYYLSPVNKEVQDIAVPMMKSFRLLN